jgi:hypothetical protein
MPCTQFYASILYIGKTITPSLSFISSLSQVPSPEFRQRRESGLQYVVSQPILSDGVALVLIYTLGL